ncbi:MAG: redoxin domain-containing protein [Gemmataceae bacterium]
MLSGGLAGAAGPSTAKLGKQIDNVAFQNAAGQKFALHDHKGKKAVVVVFLSFDCPVSNSYAPVLAELAKTYAVKDVAFMGVCPCEETPAQIARHVQDYALPFPVFADPQLKAADALKAEITPEAFVLDHNFVVRYRGRIDNGYYARLKKNARVTSHDLRDALDDLLAGKPVREPATEAIGCAIVRDGNNVSPKGQVTYYRDVLPILQANCQSCHRPGEVGPFSLLTYKQAVNWAADIQEYTQNRRMPPWKPVAGVPFHDERKLTDAEIATLAAWVEGGTPAGNPDDAPPPKEFITGWQLGKPDLVLQVPDDFQIGPSGRDVFRCFVFPTDLPEDTYVTAVEVRPGNSRVVHHTLHFVDTTGTARRLERQEQERDKDPKELDSGPGYSVSMGVGFVPRGAMGGWAPGQVPRHLPEGTGYYLPKGADVVMQVHYHRTGRLEKDRTTIGLHLAKKPVDKPFKGAVIPGRFLFIPPNEANFRVEGVTWIDRDCELHSIMPHMHMLGKKIKVTMTPPDGKPQTLIAIEEWDYNWQETYFFKKPIAIQAGTRFDVEAFYDNTADNPNNPFHPPRYVKFGQQTDDEMCFVFLGGTTDGTPGRIPQRRTPPLR